MRSTTSFCSRKVQSRTRSSRCRDAEQQRRRDVVGQVADDPQRRGAAPSKSNSSASPSCSSRPARAAEALPQRRGEIAVDLDHVEVARAAEQSAVSAPCPGRSRPSHRRRAARSPRRCVRAQCGRQESAARSACARGSMRGHARGELEGEREAAIRLPASAAAGARRDRAPCRGPPRCGRRAGRASR